MTARHCQWGIAAIFWVLGGWALLAPAHVIHVVFTPQYQSDELLPLMLMSCFGAQACLAALFATFSRFTATTFLVFAIALIPFFIFDYWFTRIVPVMNNFGAIDLVGNIIMLGLSITGWRLAKGNSNNNLLR